MVACKINEVPSLINQCLQHDFDFELCFQRIACRRHTLFHLAPRWLKPILVVYLCASSAVVAQAVKAGLLTGRSGLPSLGLSASQPPVPGVMHHC